MYPQFIIDMSQTNLTINNTTTGEPYQYDNNKIEIPIVVDNNTQINPSQQIQEEKSTLISTFEQIHEEEKQEDTCGGGSSSILEYLFHEDDDDDDNLVKSNSSPINFSCISLPSFVLSSNEIQQPPTDTQHESKSIPNIKIIIKVNDDDDDDDNVIDEDKDSCCKDIVPDTINHSELQTITPNNISYDDKNNSDHNEEEHDQEHNHHPPTTTTTTPDHMELLLSKPQQIKISPLPLYHSIKPQRRKIYQTQTQHELPGTSSSSTKNKISSSNNLKTSSPTVSEENILLLKNKLNNELGYHALYDSGTRSKNYTSSTNYNKLILTNQKIINNNTNTFIPIYRVEPVGRKLSKESIINPADEIYPSYRIFGSISSKILIVDEDTRLEDALESHIHALEKRLNRNNYSALHLFESESRITTPIGFEYSDRVLRRKHQIAWGFALSTPMTKKGITETSIPVAATYFYTRRISFWRRFCSRLKLCFTWAWVTPNSDIEVESGLLTMDSIEAFQQELNIMEYLGTKHKRTFERRQDILNL